METKYEKQFIDRFTFIEEEKLTQMKNNNIKTLGFESPEINKIDIELQLLGLGLKN